MKKKILLIDDIKEFRSMLRIILSGNYEVVTAEDGEDAMDKIQHGLRPDAIVTDLVMPKMDGYELIREIRKNQSHKNIPIIVLSNVDKTNRQNNLKRSGIAGYIVKPFHARELKDDLSRSLDNAMANCN